MPRPTLPYEIWEEIITYLGGNFRSASLVCKAWQHQSQHLLWKRVALLLHERKPSTFRRFMLHIHRYPVIGFHVEYLDLSNPEPEILVHILLQLPRLKQLFLRAFRSQIVPSTLR